jgi:hypothetical protein
VNIASKSVTSAAAARLHQNSPRKASRHKVRLHKASQEHKNNSRLVRGSLTFGTRLFSPSCPRERASRAVDMRAAAPGPRFSWGRQRRMRGPSIGYFMTPVMKIANLTESGRRGVS